MAGTSHAKQNSSSPKVPAPRPPGLGLQGAPPPHPPKARSLTVSLGQGLPAPPAQELHGRSGDGPRARWELSPEPRRRPAGWRGLAPNADGVPDPNSAAAGAGRREERQGRRGCGRWRAVARGGRSKSRPKSGVESPFGNTRKTALTPDGKSGEVALPATPRPSGGRSARWRMRGAAGPRGGGSGGSAPGLGEGGRGALGAP